MPIRPKSVSPPLEIFKVKLDRAAIDQMPADARRNLFLFGHIGNEINTGYRLLSFSTIKEQDDPIIAIYGDARAMTILRFLIGTVFEGYLAVDRSILRSPFGKNYLPHLKPKGANALKRVKAHLGNMQLIAGIRNAYSFHFPDHAQLDHAYGRLPADIDVAFYSGEARHSSLYEMSHRIMTCGMLELVPGSDTMTDHQIMAIIFEDVAQKSVALNSFLEQLFIVIVDRHNLSPEPVQVVTTVDTHHTVKTFKIPPLLRS